MDCLSALNRFDPHGRDFVLWRIDHRIALIACHAVQKNVRRLKRGKELPRAYRLGHLAVQDALSIEAAHAHLLTVNEFQLIRVRRGYL
jgi:hypothetical protein